MGENMLQISSRISRRKFAKLSVAAMRAAVTPGLWLPQSVAGTLASQPPLVEFGYGDVSIGSVLHQTQLENTHDVLMNMSEDSLLRPFRQMAGQPAPGEDLGGWYNYDPDYDWHKDDAGFAPGATFGQWISALARYYAITGSVETREKVLRLNRLYAQTISEDFYDKNRFPAYCYDKLLSGLIDSHQYARDPDAFPILDGSTWLDPLARGENVLAGKHAYSYCNALTSSMQAYLTLADEKYLRATKNAFAMLIAQSFATGGWGPDEMLRSPASDNMNASLS